MAGYDVVLFLHIAIAITGLMMAAVLHGSLFAMRSAHRAGELKWWPHAIHRVEPLLPVAALALLGTGLWLLALSDGEFAWNDPWVIASIVGLVVAEGIGAALTPRSKALQKAIEAMPDDQERGLPRPDALLWILSHTVTGLFFGVIFLMVTKPSAALSWTVLAIAAAVGALTALPFAGTRSGKHAVIAASG